MTLARIALFAFAGALLANGSALAADAPASDSPIATAGSSPSAPMSVGAQIDNYLKTFPAAQLPKDPAPGVTDGREDRKIHGQVSVAVGTGGYRSAYVRADAPLGRNGQVSIAVQDTRFNGRFGSRDYRSVGLGVALGDAAQSPMAPSCARSWDEPMAGSAGPVWLDPDAPRRCGRPMAPYGAPYGMY